MESQNEGGMTPREDNYIVPPVELLDADKNIPKNYPVDYFRTRGGIINTILREHQISAEVKRIVTGPVFTRYEIFLPPGMNVNWITSMKPEIATRLQVPDALIRLTLPLPGKNIAGIEISNDIKKMVRLREVISSKNFAVSRSPLTVAIGQNVMGVPRVGYLDRMPNLLVSGIPGAGKSVFLNSLMLSLFYKASPEQVRILPIDGVGNELGVYQGEPHLLTGASVQSKDALTALDWCIVEVQRRQRLFENSKTINLYTYNEKCESLQQAKLASIIVIVNEFKEIMKWAGKDFEERVASLAAKSATCGIHFVLTTNCPTKEVVTPALEKAFASKLAFKVMSPMDSMTALGYAGAEYMVCSGDMLYYTMPFPLPERIQGAYVTEKEVCAVVEFEKANNRAYFDKTIYNFIYRDGNGPVVETESRQAGNTAAENPVADASKAKETKKRPSVTENDLDKSQDFSDSGTVGERDSILENASGIPNEEDATQSASASASDVFSGQEDAVTESGTQPAASREEEAFDVLKTKGTAEQKEELQEKEICKQPEETKEPEKAKGKNAQQKVAADKPTENNLKKVPEKEIAKQTEKTVAKAKKTSGGYMFPPITLLNRERFEPEEDTDAYYEEKNDSLAALFREKKINAEFVQTTVGPTVVRFEYAPAIGTKLKRFSELKMLIADCLDVSENVLRIYPVQETNDIGFEIPAKIKKKVSFYDLASSNEFESAQIKIPFVLGEDLARNRIVDDLKNMPNVLIAGGGSSGKSSCINTFLMGILYRNAPDEVKFLLVDLASGKLGAYNGLPYMLTKEAVRLPEQAVSALKWTETELSRRLDVFRNQNIRNIDEYNLKASCEGTAKLPHIVTVIDEFGVLMEKYKNQLESTFSAISQHAKAAGVHIVISTSKPVSGVITGAVKSAFPTRIALRVVSDEESVTLLSETGGRELCGNGDMLYMNHMSPYFTRIQGAFVTEEEIQATCDFIKRNNLIFPDKETERRILNSQQGTVQDAAKAEMNRLALHAMKYILEENKISPSMVQKKLSIGYVKAVKLFDRLEEMGYISETQESGQKRILITPYEFMQKHPDIEVDLTARQEKEEAVSEKPGAIERNKSFKKAQGEKPERSKIADYLIENEKFIAKGLKLMLESGLVSVKLLEVRLAITYARASRLMDIMGERGLIENNALTISEAEYRSIYGDGPK